MNRSTLYTGAAVLALLFIIAACEAPETQVVEDKQEEEWQTLFAGDGFDRWKGFQSDSIPGKWVVDDNAIHYDPEAEGSGGDIVTRDEYGNFELSFDWKISECGNSGVIYLASESGDYEQPWNTGPEYQILDNTCHADAEVGTHRQAGANYDVHGPAEDLTRPAGEWNEARIVVDSMRVEHWLNGTMVVEYELGSDEWEERVAESKWTEYPGYGTMREGRIALQDHGDPVWFRNIRIREL